MKQKGTCGGVTFEGSTSLGPPSLFNQRWCPSPWLTAGLGPSSFLPSSPKLPCLLVYHLGIPSSWCCLIRPSPLREAKYHHGLGGQTSACLERNPPWGIRSMEETVQEDHRFLWGWLWGLTATWGSSFLCEKAKSQHDSGSFHSMKKEAKGGRGYMLCTCVVCVQHMWYVCCI